MRGMQENRLRYISRKRNSRKIHRGIKLDATEEANAAGSEPSLLIDAKLLAALDHARFSRI